MFSPDDHELASTDLPPEGASLDIDGWRREVTTFIHALRGELDEVGAMVASASCSNSTQASPANDPSAVGLCRNESAAGADRCAELQQQLARRLQQLASSRQRNGQRTPVVTATNQPESHSPLPATA